MLIIKDHRISILKEIAKQLKRGAVIVYPTDTAYGMGCDAGNARAVARIFKIKGRIKSKALPIICADQKMAKKFFVLVTRNSSLATRYWPGPLSIILKAKKGIAKAALKNNTAAVRVPASRIARTLSKLLGRPLIATSANISGRPACYSVKAVLRQFRHQPSPGLRPPSPVLGRGFDMTPLPSMGEGRVRGVDFILDAGALPRRKPSTIICVSKSGKIEVLRKGSVRLDIRH